MTAAFMFSSFALASGLFCAGGLSLLFLQRRTMIIRVFLVFIMSLVLINMGFWLRSFTDLVFSNTSAHIQAFSIIYSFLSLAGLVLNIAVVPKLVFSVCSGIIEPPVRQILWVWNGILLVCGLLYPFLDNPEPVVTVMNIQLIVTIAASIFYLSINFKVIPDPDMKKGIKVFLIFSCIFLFLLVFDILITRLNIEMLSFIDNLSLPVYILALNTGIFFFSGRFLNNDALMQNGRITDACRDRFSLTGRESEIIEAMFEGSTNQELADRFFISKKTVENHLYNIYQKMEVKNRVQLLGTLRSWRKDVWE